jgi:hypothetical protein
LLGSRSAAWRAPAEPRHSRVSPRPGAWLCMVAKVGTALGGRKRKCRVAAPARGSLAAAVVPGHFPQRRGRANWPPSPGTANARRLLRGWAGSGPRIR